MSFWVRFEDPDYLDHRPSGEGWLAMSPGSAKGWRFAGDSDQAHPFETPEEAEAALQVFGPMASEMWRVVDRKDGP